MWNRAGNSRRPFCVSVMLIGLAVGWLESWGSPQQKTIKSDRPQVQWGISKLGPLEVGSYDSKAEPAAEVLQALNMMNLTGWDVIRKYYPELGVSTEKGGGSVNPRDPTDTRFYAAFVNDEPGRSSAPLISMICSLEASDVSGRLKSLRAELLDAIRVKDYSQWSEQQLREGIRQFTMEQTTSKGVKYRAAKRTLTYGESVQLYGMTVAFLEKDTKWKKWQDEAERMGFTVPSPPDMHDFTKRLTHQLPVIIPPGAMRGFLLYRPGWDIGQPVTKSEYEERADAVLVKRKGNTFEAEQFPVYFTNDQKTWSPDWIEPQDDWKDTTLLGRKCEKQWTRYDGPYYWYRKDQLNGDVAYRATVKFEKGQIVVTAERFVARRGGVVRTWRDPSYDPEKMSRVAEGVQVDAQTLVVEPPPWDIPAMWRMANRNSDYLSYAQGSRELFWYSAGGNSWSSSVYLRPGETAVLRPVQPVTSTSGGIIARFDGEGALRPTGVEVLMRDEMTSTRVAVGLMNRCLEGSTGDEARELRVSLPREQDNQTPVYFYSSPKTTAVQKSPSALIVTLPEGYYNSYGQVFNRLLWVLERPFAGDAAKVAAINQEMASYLRDKFPAGGQESSDPALAAWSQVLREGSLDELFSASILPSSKPVVPNLAPASDWLRVVPATNGADLSVEQQKNGEVAVGLTNLYLGSAEGDGANMWRRWYPRGTSVTFHLAGQSDRGQAKEELREITTSEGEKHSEALVAVELPTRAYADGPSALVWMLGVLEVNARGRDRSSTGGNGSGIAGVLQYLRQLDGAKDPHAEQALSRLGLSYKTLAAWLPDVPDMFMGSEQLDTAKGASGDCTGGADAQIAARTGAPVIRLQFPNGMGKGQLGSAEQQLASGDVRLLNLFLTKKDDKKDRGAEHLRQALPSATVLHLYRSELAAVHQKPGSLGEYFVGIPAQDGTYSALFLELLRVVEMQSETLTKSPGKREDIAMSLKRFLEAYVNDNPQDEIAMEANKLDIKTMTEF